jgi:uncharacterized membrane protein YozB (DUF420 family)
MQRILPGSAAPLAADCVLVGELAMGWALIAGGFLARCRRYRAHAWCQSAVVLLNLLIVAQYMVPSFGRAVAPGLVAHIGRSYYWLATAHGVLGIGAEMLGLYILLAAGTNILPQRFRLACYKRWMRSALALWWLVLLLGLATYVRWYGVPFRPRAEPSAQGAGLATVAKWPLAAPD